MTPRLALHGLRKSYGDVEAVRSMDLALAPGEFVSLLGPSGCGKSTTLAMIAGFEEPTAGSILIDGNDVVGLSPAARRIGLVFQDYAVFSLMTVRNNLLFGLEAQRIRRRERETRVARIAKRLDLGALMTRRGASLNMSEMQRVALARVLVTEPALLLLDEPMSNLDAQTRADLRVELKLIQTDLGQSVLYVTHDQVEAMAMSDRIAVMHEGTIQQIGTPTEIYQRPKTRFVAEFIGDPPINVFACDVAHEQSSTVLRAATGHTLTLPRADLQEGEQLLAVRPHDVQVGAEEVGGAVKARVAFLENLGAEHVLHVEMGSELVASVVRPGTATVGDVVWASIPAGKCHLIGRQDGRVAAR